LALLAALLSAPHQALPHSNTILDPLRGTALADAGGAWLPLLPGLRPSSRHGQWQLQGGSDWNGLAGVALRHHLPVDEGSALSLMGGLQQGFPDGSALRLQAGMSQALRRGSSAWMSLGVGMQAGPGMGRAGSSAAFNAAVAAPLTWPGWSLGAGLRERPLLGPGAPWRRDASIGLTHGKGARRWVGDLSYAADSGAWALHGGYMQDLQPGWQLRTGLSTPADAAGPWMLGAGLLHQRGALQFEATLQAGLGHAMRRLQGALSWTLPALPRPAKRRAPRRRAEAAAPPADGPPASGQAWALRSAQADGRLQLSWDPVEGAAHYEVQTSLILEASMRLAEQGRVRSPAWEGDLGLRGVTRYYRVRAFSADGAELGASAVLKALAGGTP
jgi:hypothetical protein